MVWQAAKAVKIPVVGMGGIMTGDDAIEFLLAGASSVSVGTASFINPEAAVDVIKGIEKHMQRYKYSNMNQIIGKVEIN